MVFINEEVSRESVFIEMYIYNYCSFMHSYSRRFPSVWR